MVCKRCGAVMEDGAKVCPACGEGSSPELVPLAELSEVPADPEQLHRELLRLQEYFAPVMEKYETMEDLWLMASHWREPSITHWALGGLFAMALCWLLLWGSETGLNLETSGLPMLVWVIVSAGGYTLSRHQYTRNKQRKDEAALHVENELRQHYNAAENCFLPFEYTAPAAMRELIDGLEKGTIQSFEDYRVRMV